MLVDYKNQKLLLPFDSDYYYWYKRNDAEAKFFSVAVPTPDSCGREALMICAKCGTHVGIHYRWQKGLECPNCHCTYTGDDYRTEFVGYVKNCLIGLPKIKRGKAEFDLYQFVENRQTGTWEPEVFCTIRYSKDEGLETLY